MTLTIADMNGMLDDIERNYNKQREAGGRAMEGTVTSTEFNGEDQTSVAIEVSVHNANENYSDETRLTFSLPQDKARRFPVGTLVELGIKVKRG